MSVSVSMAMAGSASVAGYRHGRVPRAVREQQLQAVALALFAERGYQGTSIEDIRLAAGISRPVFYDHFGSKDDVYLACLRQAREQLDASIDAAVDEHDEPGRQLWLGINAYLQFVGHNTAAWEVLFGGGAAIVGPAAEEARRLRFATVNRMAALMQRVVPEFEPRMVEALAHALSGAGEQLAKWWRATPGLELDEVARFHMAFAWFGLERLMAEARAQNG